MKSESPIVHVPSTEVLTIGRLRHLLELYPDRDDVEVRVFAGLDWKTLPVQFTRWDHVNSKSGFIELDCEENGKPCLCLVADVHHLTRRPVPGGQGS